MAKWLKLNFGSKRDPPQPPRPDYTESEILRAYRAQKELDFEDPYQHTDKEHQNGGFSPTMSLPSFPAFGSVLPNGMEVWIKIHVLLAYQTLYLCSIIKTVNICLLAGESGVPQTQTN